ncbi:unnamed protein product [Moneuplotes crassus]|uniref:Uncharacterized protein n=1 Tax=Euplotes crassus TaxID=5936 RepID=A0AAD1Y207_EUPCR|nr:unnamed protein product [Moneuplotes crassus]
MFTRETSFFDFNQNLEKEEYFGDILFENTLENEALSLDQIDYFETPTVQICQKEVSITSPLMIEREDVLNDFNKFYKKQVSQVSSALYSTHGAYNQEQGFEKSCISVNKEKLDSKFDTQANLDSKTLFNSGLTPKYESEILSDKVKFSARRRFNKSHDREMFKRLIELCKECQVQVSDFWSSATILSSELWGILERIAAEISWSPSKLDQLLTRIKKIGKNPDKFSARDNKLLRKLVNQQKRNGYIDYQEVLYYFPGKSLETIKKKYGEKWSPVPHKLS